MKLFGLQEEAALIAVKNLLVALLRRGTLVVSMTGTNGQKDPHSSIKMMEIE